MTGNRFPRQVLPSSVRSDCIPAISGFPRVWGPVSPAVGIQDSPPQEDDAVFLERPSHVLRHCSAHSAGWEKETEDLDVAQK